MKVGIFRRRYVAYGGAERLTQHFLEGAAAAGHDIHLFCQEWTDAPAGVATHRVPAPLGGSTVRTLSYALLAPCRARRVGVDLVHSFERTLRQDLYRAGEGCHRQWLALRRRHQPRGSSAFDGFRPFHRLVLAIERRICRGRGAKLIVVNSQMVERDFVRHYSPLRVPITLIRNGVDLDRFNPDVRALSRRAAREALGLAAGQLTLVMVGSGFSRKGLPAVVRALGHLRRRKQLHPMVLVAGKGNATPILDLATREGVGQQLRFLGTVEDTGPLYAAADLFVLPSLYDPASTATLEALASGLPVITTKTNGSSELLEHQRSGWLLDDPADFRGLAGLVDAAADPRVAGSVAEAGRKAVGPWTWERHLSETLALYPRLARSSS